MSEKLWKDVLKLYVKAGAYPFPTTDTMLEILKLFITEEQAEFLLNFRKSSYNLEQIKEKIKMDETVLQEKLDELAFIGALTKIPSRSTGIMVYRMPPFFPGLLEFTLMKPSRTEKDYKIARLWENFFNEMVDYTQINYDKFVSLLEESKMSLERIVPVESEIKTKDEIILSTNELSKFIEEQESIGLATCYCRNRKDLLDDPCKKTKVRKNCFAFSKTADFLISQGFAEKISKEEAIRILRECEDSGLIHKAFHARLDPKKEIDAICNCCDCCCGTFSVHFAGGIPLMSQSSFIAVVNEENCVGCGTCVEFCNAAAIELEDAVAKVIDDRCLGCGICGHHCPEDAITLNAVETRRVFVPPPRIKN